MKVEHKAYVSFTEIEQLVEKYLESQGYQRTPGAMYDQATDGSLRVSVQPLQEKAPAPAAEPKPKSNYELSGKRQEVLRKARAKYAEKKKAEKAAAQKQEPAQEVQPTVQAQEESKGKAIFVQRPEAHEHSYKVYPITTFSDPDQPNHKHFRRMCTGCGANEQVDCLACKALAEITELKERQAHEQEQEVVAPSTATFLDHVAIG